MSEVVKLFLINYEVRNDGKTSVGSTLAFAENEDAARREWERTLGERYPGRSFTDIKVGGGYTADQVQRRFTAAALASAKKNEAGA